MPVKCKFCHRDIDDVSEDFELETILDDMNVCEDCFVDDVDEELSEVMQATLNELRKVTIQ